MNLKDILLTPFFLVLIYAGAYVFRSSIRDQAIRRYFIPALSAKLLGAIALGLIYQFYYHGGDTFNFFKDSEAIWEAFLDSPWIGLRIIFAEVGDYSPELYQYTKKIYFFSYGDAATYNVIRLSGFLSIISFHTYTVNALFFALISFSGTWAMYRVFYDMYPTLHWPLAVAVFFIPSVFFWGSGLMKDTIALGALGWAFYGFYFALIRRRDIIWNLGILLFSILVVRSVKVYIIGSFLPAAFLWLFLEYRTQIKSKALRQVSFPFLLMLSIPFGYLSLIQITADNERYQLENIAATAKTTADWLAYVSEQQGGSGYSLGEFEWTPVGLASVAPRAIWLGLFQPHLWQATNPVMLLSAVEATIFLIITIRIILSTSILKLYHLSLAQPIILFCLIFSLILAFGVAIASYNFGTLVRYRIPMMPFYLTLLYIIRYHTQGSKRIF